MINTSQTAQIPKAVAQRTAAAFRCSVSPKHAIAELFTRLRALAWSKRVIKPGLGYRWAPAPVKTLDDPGLEPIASGLMLDVSRGLCAISKRRLGQRLRAITSKAGPGAISDSRAKPSNSARVFFEGRTPTKRGIPPAENAKPRGVPLPHRSSPRKS